jgi:hypothetical protein
MGEINLMLSLLQIVTAHSAVFYFMLCMDRWKSLGYPAADNGLRDGNDAYTKRGTRGIQR